MATDKKLNSLDEKFKKDELKFEPIKNEDLICKDCQHKYNDNEFPCNTSKCEVYEVKPDEVLDGGSCNEYSKEE